MPITTLEGALVTAVTSLTVAVVFLVKYVIRLHDNQREDSKHSISVIERMQVTVELISRKIIQ